MNMKIKSCRYLQLTLTQLSNYFTKQLTTTKQNGKQMQPDTNNLNAVILNKNELFQLSELCQSEYARLTFVKPYDDNHAETIKDLQNLYIGLSKRFSNALEVINLNSPYNY